MKWIVDVILIQSILKVRKSRNSYSILEVRIKGHLIQYSKLEKRTSYSILEVRKTRTSYSILEVRKTRTSYSIFEVRKQGHPIQYSKLERKDILINTRS